MRRTVPQDKVSIYRGNRRFDPGAASTPDRLANAEDLTNPLPGLTPAQLGDFNDGLEEFMEEETPEDGLGPVFNGKSCAECHAVPSVGGFEPNVGVARETRIGRRVNGNFDPLDGTGPGGVNEAAACCNSARSASLAVRS